MLIRKEYGMVRGRRHTPEEIVQLLRRIDAETARGTKTNFACYEAGITATTYYKWYREYVNLTVDQANQLKALNRMNRKPKRPTTLSA